MPGGRICLNFQADILRPRAATYAAARLVGRLCGSDWRMENGDTVGWAMIDGRPYYGWGHAFVPEEIERESAAAGLRLIFRRDPPDDPVYVLTPATP